MLRIIDDKTHEPSKTIQATVSSPTNAVLGAKTRHTYTIIDNDPVNIGHAAMNRLATDGVFAEMARPDAKRQPIHNRLAS